MHKIAIDFETHLISNQAPIPGPICLSYYNGTQEGLVHAKDAEKYLKAMLESAFIITHNAKFELLVIYEHYPKLRPLVWKALEEGRVFCTLIYERLINNTQKKQAHGFSLDKLVFQYFNKDISDLKQEGSWRTRYSELEDLTIKEWPKEAIDYAIEDSIWAYKIYEKQTVDTHEFISHVRADFCLNYMGQFGIMIDKERVKILRDEVDAIMEPNYNILLDKGIYRKEKGKIVKSMNVLRKYITNTYTEIERTNKGTVATSGNDLDKYLTKNPDDVILKAHLDIMTYEKIKTSFLNNLLQADPTIRTQYTAVVSSGRTSASKSNFYPSVNIQQMPRGIKNVTWDVRNCFIPRPGYKICSIDYAGLELASTANQLKTILGKSEMCDIINSGEIPVDMHSRFAYILRNLSGKYPKCDYKEFSENKKKPTYKEFRQLAKPINLGFPGGIGYDTMRLLLFRDGITPKLKVLEEDRVERSMQWLARLMKYRGAKGIRVRRVAFDKYQLVYDELVELKQNLFNLYPDLRYFLQEGHNKYLTGEAVNRKNEFGEWEKEEMYSFEAYGFKRDWCTYTSFCNGYMMQTPAAVGAKNAVYKVCKQYMGHPEVNPLDFIHDELLLEIKDNANVYNHIKDISELMIDGMQEVLKCVRITVEADLMDYWTKEGGNYSVTYWKNTKDNTLYTL